LLLLLILSFIILSFIAIVWTDIVEVHAVRGIYQFNIGQFIIIGEGPL
jgi:hypothetical protein